MFVKFPNCVCLQWPPNRLTPNVFFFHRQSNNVRFVLPQPEYLFCNRFYYIKLRELDDLCV